MENSGKKFGWVKRLVMAAGVFFLTVTALSIILALFSGNSALAFGDKVAVVTINGIITDSEDINYWLREFGERDDVKAVVLRIDSPGGGVGPSQEIHREVKRLKGSKKVVTSMGGLAASGGYYIASASDIIVANPGTITGSIGVIIEFINMEGLFEKIGLKGSVIKSGKYKDTGSPLRELTGEEEKLLQDVIDDVHRQFVEAVAEGRNLSLEEVRAIADGRILSGAQARELGLVDRLGGLEDAIAAGAELAGLEEKPPVIYSRDRGGAFDSIFNGSIGSSLTDLWTGMRVMYLLPGTPGTLR
ncbi:MAG: signal peptide peptidase SppA [Thermodesulfobacteriota bacterium]